MEDIDDEAAGSGQLGQSSGSTNTRELTQYATGGSNELQPSQSGTTNPIQLQLDLSRAIIRRQDGTEFLPIDELDRIICRKKVVEELRKYYPMWNSRKFNDLAAIICDKRLEERVTEQETDLSDVKLGYTSC